MSRPKTWIRETMVSAGLVGNVVRVYDSMQNLTPRIPFVHNRFYTYLTL